MERAAPIFNVEAQAEGKKWGPFVKQFRTETGTASQSIFHGDVVYLLARRPIPVRPHVFLNTAIYTEDKGNRLHRNFGTYLPQHLPQSRKL